MADCQEPWRVLTALGAIFFLLGFRFAVLRWRELAIAERRIRCAVRETQSALSHGVNALRPPNENHVEQSALQDATDEDPIVRATSAPPPPLA